MRLCRCGAIVDGRCEKCDSLRQQNREFYGSHRWRKLSEAKRKAEPLCECCLELGRVTPAEEVHHKQPVSDFPKLAFVWGNLLSVCGECHRRLDGQRR